MMKNKQTQLFKQNSGFTLIEVCVVVGIIGAMALIAIPNYISKFPYYRLKSASRDIYGAMQKAKIAAIKDNTSVRIRFADNATPGYYYFDTDNDSIADAGEERINLINYGSGVDLGSGAATNDWGGAAINQADFITFNNKGANPHDVLTFNNRATSNAGTIYLESQLNSDCFAITVTTTGSLRLRYFDGSNWK